MKLIWNRPKDKIFEAGVDRGVLYPAVGPGIVWDGLVSISESDSDVVQKVLYVDGERKISQINVGTFSGVLSAMTYPEEFEQYDGYIQSLLTAQKRSSFGFSYRSLIGNQIKDLSLGYKIHILYNVLADPTNNPHQTINPDSDITPFEWDLSTIPIEIPGFKPSAHLIIDSRTTHPIVLSTIEDWLYGTDEIASRLPLINEIIDLFDARAIFQVVPHGDGTVTISGSDESVYSLGHDNLWKIDFFTVEKLEEHLYFARSY